MGGGPCGRPPCCSSGMPHPTHRRPQGPTLHIRSTPAPTREPFHVACQKTSTYKVGLTPTELIRKSVRGCMEHVVTPLWGSGPPHRSTHYGVSGFSLVRVRPTSLHTTLRKK